MKVEDGLRILQQVIHQLIPPVERVLVARPTRVFLVSIGER
jgi:hypothetical protein